LQAKVQESQVLQAEALLRHGLLDLLGSHDLLCVQCLCCPDHLLRSPALLLHGVGLLLLGSRRLLLGSGCNLLRAAADLLHSGCHVLRGSRRQLLCSVGLVSACQ
jgi:hypothetical protein